MRVGVQCALLMLLGLMFVGCAVQVKPSDLIGNWRMTDEGIQRLNLKQVRPKFSLSSDGSLTAENVPSSAFGDSNSWKSMYSGTGTWTIPVTRRTQGFASVVLNFKQTGPNQPTGLSLQIDKDSSGLYVFVWLDEEGGERLIYRR
jgi:hypothetical protein